jgi:hypothetical protein
MSEEMRRFSLGERVTDYIKNFYPYETVWTWL